MSVTSIKGQLIKELMETKEYMNLKNSKIILSQNPDYSGEILKFQKLQDSLFQSRLNNEDSAAISEELSKEYDRLAKVPEIYRYFNAVNSMNMLINNILNDINLAVDNSLR